MREAKKKWIISYAVCAVLKALVVAAGLFILSTATGILSGTLPPVVSAMSIIGAAAVAHVCIGIIIKLEGIISALEKYMKRQRLILARLKKTLHTMNNTGQIQSERQEASV